MSTSVVIGHDTTTSESIGITASNRHLSTYVIGKPGMGKSTLLESIALQDMEHGDGLCFLDPHGDSVEKLLSMVPRHRATDVIYWDPKDITHPFGLNPFTCTNRDDQLLVDQLAENFLSALASLEEFSEVFKQAPRMSDILRHLAFAFLLTDGYTLLETPRFLNRSDFRCEFYKAIHARRRIDILEYWEEFDDVPAREQRELVASALNKLRRLTTTTVLRLLFGQETNSIDFRTVMDQGRIVLVNLHNLGEGNAEVIGAFIVWGILSAAYSRGNIPWEQRRPFHLIADEFQKFTSTAFPKLVDEGRKYRVDTIVAHQGRDQLEGQTRGATLRAPNRIVFQVTGADARELAWEFDTTPPPPEVVNWRPILTLSSAPWDELLQSGHQNLQVREVMNKIATFFYHRNLSSKSEERFGKAASGVVASVEMFAIRGTPIQPFKTTEWGIIVNFFHQLSMAGIGRWANPYLLDREQGRNNSAHFLGLVRAVVQLRDTRYDDDEKPLMLREEAEKPLETWEHRVNVTESATEKLLLVLQYELAQLFGRLMQELGDLLAQAENHIQTESGQYEAVYGPQLSSDEVANRIANELVHLAPHAARCQIGGHEYTITTNNVSNEASEDKKLAAAIRRASQVSYGRDRQQVDGAIVRRAGYGLEDGSDAMMEGDGKPNPDPDSPSYSDIFTSPDI